MDLAVNGAAAAPVTRTLPRPHRRLPDYNEAQSRSASFPDDRGRTFC